MELKQIIGLQINKEYNQLKSLGNAYETDQYAGVRLAVPKFFINGREPERLDIDNIKSLINDEKCKKDTLETIYRNFNFSFSKENKKLIESYIEKNAKSSKEKHVYSLEEYGLDKKEVHNRLQ